MKVFTSFLAILLLSFSLFAQNKNDAPGDNASLEDIQKWLVKTIGKNSSFSYKNSDNKTTDIIFNGCRLSYRLEMKSISDPSLPDITDQKMSAPPGMRPARSTSFMFTGFNLTDMDPAGFVLKPAGGLAKDMTQITLSTLGGKETVDLNFHSMTSDPNKLNTIPGGVNGSKKGSLAQLVVKKTVAEQIKDELVRAIKLCQQP